MNENYRNRILEQNSWIDSNEKYGLVLTDDIDSLLGCSILKQIKGWDIEQIFLFKANPHKDKDYLGTIKGDLHESIGIDFARTEGKCFDNHLCNFNYNDISNPESVNLNNLCGIHRGIYGKKYNLSTVLLLWSLYDLPKTGLSEELKMFLLAIDSSYFSYFHGFHQQNRKWMVDVLDLPEFFECQQNHEEQEFEDIAIKYGIHSKKSKGHGKITSEKGYLSTQIDIEGINELLAWETDIEIKLPEEKFYRKAIFEDMMKEIKGFPSSIKTICEKPFCYALTKKQYVNYSVQVDF